MALAARSVRGIARAAALLALAGSVALPQVAAANDTKPPSMTKRVEDALQARVADGERMARIQGLGPEAIPVLLDVLGSDTVPFGSAEAVVVDERKEALIVASLAKFDRAQLLPVIGRSVTESASPRLRRACIGVLGAVGDRRDLALLCRIAAPAAVNDDLDGTIEPTLRNSARAILLRDFGGYLAVQDLLRSQYSATRICLYRALADTASSQSMPVLVQRLGTDPLEDPILLAEIQRGSRWVPLPPEIGVREALRVYLRAEQANLVTAATASLGNLEDADSVPELIQHLAHEDSFVRETSHAALCRITGEKLLPDRDRWAAWYASECDWYKNRAQACVEDLRTEVGIRKNVAISEISRHALFREEFTVHLLRMLPHESEGLQRLAICALGLMGSTSAVPYLESMASESGNPLAPDASEALGKIRERRPKPEKPTAAAGDSPSLAAGR